MTMSLPSIGLPLRSLRKRRGLWSLPSISLKTTWSSPVSPFDISENKVIAVISSNRCILTKH
ncbi:hypothetical protein PGT21_009530 [Puccinia graminis f. sp. tritici]|uniref:Uncharacterized protein n=1 Tax=Puccinia graminis f. sp. tritici TaxID=56615 RepID=A0A5B0Q5K7_PUCGR|nr:hypothetical protein PGT21_009530 [Puccinia graminis f. sp. tritici]